MSQYKTFVLPFVPDEAAEEELNAFLRSHRVIAVERVREAIGWCFCVEWLEGRPGESPSGRGLRYAEKVDYMKVLDPPTFAVFSKLRARRKEMAREAGLPAFSGRVADFPFGHPFPRLLSHFLARGFHG